MLDSAYTRWCKRWTAAALASGSAAVSKAVRLFPLAYGWMPSASLRIGVDAEPAEEDAEVGVERDVAKPSLRGGTLASDSGGGAFLHD